MNSPPASSSSPPASYGDAFEPWIILAMSLLIVASFIGVYLLWQHYTPECRVMDYTYCPEQQTTDSHSSS